MNKDELIDKILSDLYMNSNRGMDFYDDFCVYENDINRLEEAKKTMEREGLIIDYKNLKTGISPLGFKMCFDGGYLDEKVKKERHIKKIIQKKNQEVSILKRKNKSLRRFNTFLLILLLFGISLAVLLVLGLVDLSFISVMQ